MKAEKKMKKMPVSVSKKLFLIESGHSLDPFILKQLQIGQDQVIVIELETSETDDYLTRCINEVSQENMDEIYVVVEENNSSGLGRGELLGRMKEYGITEEKIRTVEEHVPDVNGDVLAWLMGGIAENAQQKVSSTLNQLVNHPLLLDHLKLYGLIVNNEDKRMRITAMD